MNKLQLEASNPQYSVWVSASAGTGKTKILTDRVLRLLISGVEFKSILCLTFTNAAVAEMQSRILEKLLMFSNSSFDVLKDSLKLLLGRAPNQCEIDIALSLYSKFINNIDHSIGIYTIHSFCQKLLKAFPIESGLSPAFEILSDIDAQYVINYIKKEFLYSFNACEIVNYFIHNFHTTVLDEIFDQIIAQRLKFKQNITVQISLRRDIDPKMLDAELKKRFLNKDGSKRKNLGKNVTQSFLDAQDKVYAADQQEKLNAIIDHSEKLLKFAHLFLERYESYKKQNSLLDYDDLIFYTKILLNNSDAKDWVLYKLDQNIEHLLVDEAQDTSIDQWAVIESIISEFYSGLGSVNKNRTIFIVGDEKQSIFKFQGADVESFSIMNNALKSNLLSANKLFKQVNLQISYRSTQLILDSISRIFMNMKNLYPELCLKDYIELTAYRKDEGKIELWPIIKSQKPNLSQWPLPKDHLVSVVSPKSLLAIQIAKYIKHTIENQVVLPSTQRPAEYKDFMILVRKRDDFTNEIIKQLQNYDLAVEGLDRVILNNDLTVLDLIAIAKFVLNQLDDLNLACLLKSPIINCSDEDIEYLRLLNPASNLWDTLCQSNIENNNLVNALSILNLLVKVYNQVDSYEFFNIIMDVLDLRSCISQSNIDAINEFLYLIRRFYKTQYCSLQRFLYWFENCDVQIKRNLTSPSKIRVMTVHGAKGLESPIVILADTTSVPLDKSKFIFKNNNFFVGISSAKNSEFFLGLKEQESIKEIQEYIRLLYVALTRAADHLIVCGYANAENLPKQCWYEIVSSGLKSGLGIEAQNNEKYSIIENATQNYLQSKPWIPQWIPNINAIQKFLHDEQEYSVSPLKTSFALKYGKAMHKILEDVVKTKNIQLLEMHPVVCTLPIHVQDKAIQTLKKLSVNEEFLEILNYHCQTEVSVGIHHNGNVLLQRLDLLVFTKEEIQIIDYKSDVILPTSPDQIPVDYVMQLRSYKNAIHTIYPTYEIITKILWLEDTHFTIVSCS